MRRIKPDIVLSHDVDEAGYLTLEARSALADWFPVWIAASWGCDLRTLSRLSGRVHRIKSVLAECDYYASDCDREVALLHDLGFNGKLLPLSPIGAGYDLNRLWHLREAGPASARRQIAMNGTQSWSGRALVGLRAIELSATSLGAYSLAVYWATPEVRVAAQLVSHEKGIPVDFVPKLYGASTSQDEMLRVHGSARLSIGLSIGEDLSASYLDAMVMGSFPIQSNTGRADKWLQDGETALFVHPDDPEAVAVAIRRAVTDDALIDRAAEANCQIARERLDESMLRRQVVALCREAMTRAQ